jgi:hypothetical protein
MCFRIWEIQCVVLYSDEITERHYFSLKGKGRKLVNFNHFWSIENNSSKKMLRIYPKTSLISLRKQDV